MIFHVAQLVADDGAKLVGVAPKLPLRVPAGGKLVNLEGSLREKLELLAHVVSVAAAPLRNLVACVERCHLEAREQYEDCYFAVLMLSGSQWLEQDGRQVLLRPGDFAFYDGSRPHHLTFSRHWGEQVRAILPFSGTMRLPQITHSAIGAPAFQRFARELANW